MRSLWMKQSHVRLGMLFGLLLLALAAAACMPSALPAATVAPTEAAAMEPTATEAVMPTATVEMTPTVEMTATVAMTTTAVTSPATVMVSDTAPFGPILTDDKGMVLYLFTNDVPGTSNCYDKCAVNWPPLLTAGNPVAGEGADAALLGTTARTDGTTQVTYNGWPLYYWIKDTKPGDTTGQGVGEVWYVLSPKGEMVKAAAAEATVKVTESATLGPILTDDKGMTLYLYTNDTPGTSNCYDKCAVNWPPLLTTGAPVAGEGAMADLFGTTTRKDGTTQVTYNGWPLYYWIKDTKPGDTTGQGVGEVWYVLSPAGKMVKTAAAEATATPAAAMGETVKVTIKGFSFGDPITVKVGTTVEWTNADSAPHTVTASDGAFDSGRLATDAAFSFTFTKAGTYNYTCQLHPNMKGQVIVTE